MEQMQEIDLMDMFVIPEEVVELCSETLISTYGEEERNTFSTVLSQGKLLKDAGRTPIYLCTQDMLRLYVTSQEKINKDYH